MGGKANVDKPKLRQSSNIKREKIGIEELRVIEGCQDKLI